MISPENEDRLFVHTHGGGFSIGYGDAAPFEAISIAHYAQMRAISIDYRTIPLHPFPVALDDVLAVYLELLKDYDPAAMAMGGSSAGGNLAMASILNFNMQGVPTPALILAAHLGPTLLKRATRISLTKALIVFCRFMMGYWVNRPRSMQVIMT